MHRIRGGSGIQNIVVDLAAQVCCNLRRIDDMIKHFNEDVKGIDMYIMKVPAAYQY
jgi:hypothetical protein